METRDRDQDSAVATRYVQLSRDEWAHLREATPLTLSEEDVDRLRGLNDPVSVKEVVEIYLPLSRLLNLRVAATQGLHASTTQFLGTTESQPPYIIGIAGSVAVGKSTTARLLQALLARWPDHPRVDLVTTDGFLMPNADARRARADAAEGVSRELRRPPPGAVRCRRQGRSPRRARACLLAHPLRHRRRANGRSCASPTS